MEKCTRQPVHLQLVQVKQHCIDCTLRQLCLPASLPASEIEQLAPVFNSPRWFRKRERIYAVGDRFRALFVVRRGSVKTQAPMLDGGLDITGFYLPGDLIGAESIGQEGYSLDAIALEPTELCELPLQGLEQACQSAPFLLHGLLALLGDALRRQQKCNRSNREHRADERVLCFLLDLRWRLRQRQQLRPEGLELPMSKSDISTYLHMTAETFSRAIRRLQSQGLLKCSGQRWQLGDLDAINARLGIAKR